MAADWQFHQHGPIELVAGWQNGQEAVAMLKLLMEPNDVLATIPAGKDAITAAAYAAASLEAVRYLVKPHEETLPEQIKQQYYEGFPRRDGLTLSQYHAFKGRYEIAEYFVKKGIKLSLPGTPLRHWVFKTDKSRLFDAKLETFLREHGVSLNERDSNGYTLLHGAVVQGDAKLVAHLLAAGADPDVPNEKGDTALHAAVWSGNRDLVNQLLSKAKPSISNHKGRTPLHEAFARGDWGMANALLDRGARVDIADFNRQTPIFDCVRSGCPNIERLAVLGASFTLRDIDENSLLHIAASAAPNSMAVQKLFRAGMPINEKNGGGQTPLHLAAERNNHSLTQLLLAKGAAVNVRDNLGNTPLHLATSAEVIKVLLDGGADPDIANNAGIRPVNEARERSQMLFHSPTLISGRKDNLPRYFSAIRVEGQPDAELINPTEAMIGAVDQDGEDRVSTSAISFIPRSPALEVGVQQACEMNVRLYKGGETLGIALVPLRSTWEWLKPVEEKTLTFRGIVYPARCGLTAPTVEIVLAAVAKKTSNAKQWEKEAKACSEVPIANAVRCQLQMRPILRVLVRNDQNWREAGVLYPPAIDE